MDFFEGCIDFKSVSVPAGRDKASEDESEQVADVEERNGVTDPRSFEPIIVDALAVSLGTF